MIQFTAGNNDSGQRIDRFLLKKYKSLPPSMMYKLIRKKKITVNRKRVHEDYMLAEGDVVSIFAPPDIFGENRTQAVLRPLGPVKVVYEDGNIIIVDKPSGLLVHSDDAGGDDTLIDRIKYYLYKKSEYDPEHEQSFAPALCNRIDRNTQGLVIAAKNAIALREMNDIIKNRNVLKKYLAVAHGVLTPPEGEIKLLLEKDSASNTVKVKRARTGRGTKTAVTEYKTVAVSKSENLSLLEIRLVTGRTHQIRVSLAHIGHPLLGDGKYAINKEDRDMGYHSQALCSYSLEFKGIGKYKNLSYLEGKVFTAGEPDFIKLF